MQRFHVAERGVTKAKKARRKRQVEKGKSKKARRERFGVGDFFRDTVQVKDVGRGRVSVLPTVWSSSGLTAGCACGTAMRAALSKADLEAKRCSPASNAVENIARRRWSPLALPGNKGLYVRYARREVLSGAKCCPVVASHCGAYSRGAGTVYVQGNNAH